MGVGRGLFGAENSGFGGENGGFGGKIVEVRVFDFGIFADNKRVVVIVWYIDLWRDARGGFGVAPRGIEARSVVAETEFG